MKPGWMGGAVAIVVTACAAPESTTGDVERGRQVFVSRDQGHCVICHSAPGVKESGNVGPALVGVGSRLSPAEIRVRVEDITRVNPDAVMPAFHKVEGLQRVVKGQAGKPLLSTVQVDDVVAYLSSLK
ncbi:sulfur oxidation c-type cytochrome SoxX [Betaproteobacteria bacterium GR16-43]|nr:sulfur oxidation c-type cytochrome SoxX [Betaproteobacteria bacterium GR16-43]